MAQGKLFLAGVASFFPTDPVLVLTIALVVYVLFLWLNVIIAPCLIKVCYQRCCLLLAGGFCLLSAI